MRTLESISDWIPGSEQYYGKGRQPVRQFVSSPSGNCYRFGNGYIINTVDDPAVRLLTVNEVPIRSRVNLFDIGHKFSFDKTKTK